MTHTCPQCLGIEKEFDRALAARDLRKYRKRGPARTTRMLLDALNAAGVDGLSLLDIGGGIGAVQHELVKSGVRTVTGIDASTAYLQAAEEEASRQGYADRVRYRHGDFVALAEAVGPAGIVTLDRVLCCYPDVQALVGRSAERAQHLYGVVYPRRTGWTRLGFKLINLICRIRRTPFRIFLHAPEAVDALIRAAGLSQRYYGKTMLWQVAVYGR
jgi:magnesium-protoporphyrin O-methyltransferase